MREAAADHLGVESINFRATGEEVGFLQVLVVLLVKVVDDGGVVPWLRPNVLGNDADRGRVVFVSVHALLDGVAADETHCSVGELQDAVVKVVDGVVGLGDVAAKVLQPRNPFATGLESEHVAGDSDTKSLRVDVYLDYVLEAEKADGTRAQAAL